MFVVVVVAGVSGSGKSTVGTLLAGRLGWGFKDGDSLHPAANIAKMAAGDPLTDADRRPWLLAVVGWIDERVAAGRPAVVACSALKRGYRDQLVDGRPAVGIAFLDVGREAAAARVAARRDHFCPPNLIESQFADLEPPTPDEPRVVLVAAVGPPDAIARDITGRLGLAA